MKLKVTVNGTAYDVEVEVEEEQRAATLESFTFGNGLGAMANAPLTPSNAAVPASEEKVLRAPISGTVMKVVTEPGAMAQEGTVLLVLEAMKMETEITAPVPGTVAEIAVAPGDAVTSGQTLLTWA